MNPLFDRSSHERLQRVDAALSGSASAWRREPRPELRGRVLAAVDAHSRARRTPTGPRAAWIALAAGLMIAWLAWHAFVPLRPSPARSLVASPAENLVRHAWNELPAPSLARAIDRPLVAEVGHMRADVSRAFDFLVARVSLPLMTRARGD